QRPALRCPDFPRAPAFGDAPAATRPATGSVAPTRVRYRIESACSSCGRTDRTRSEPRPKEPEMKKIIVTIVTVLAVAVFSGSAVARTVPIEPTNVGRPIELVWGNGSLPHLVPVRTTRNAEPPRVTRVDLRRMRRVFVPVTGGRTNPALFR